MQYLFTVFAVFMLGRLIGMVGFGHTLCLHIFATSIWSFARDSFLHYELRMSIILVAFSVSCEQNCRVMPIHMRQISQYVFTNFYKASAANM